jgi:hypothetical protein
LHTGFAPNATVAAKIDDSVIAPEQGSNRADRYAWSIVTVIAPEDREEAARVRMHSLLNVLDPGAKRAQRYVVL